LFTLFNLLAKFFENSTQSQRTIQILIFSVLAFRNLMASAIAYYFSIYLVNRNSQNQPKNQNGELHQNLGTFAIEDFDVAMKS